MIQLLLAVAVATSACAAPEAVERQATVVGQARSVGASESDPAALRYCEYFLVDDAGKVRVLYYDPRGQKIAEKHLSSPVANSPEAPVEEARPSVLQEDFRLGEIREITRVGNSWRMRYRKNLQDKVREVTVPDAKVDVIDAGFDPFVRRHWELLVSGGNVEFNFASPLHGQVIRLRARVVACGARVAAAGHLCLTVEPANALLRWLAGDLFLAYSSDNRRLRYFSGVVNLQDTSGTVQKLSIRYSYR